MAKKARVYEIPEWAKIPAKVSPTQETEIQSEQSEPKQMTPRELLEEQIVEYERMYEQYHHASSLLDAIKEEKSRVWEFIKHSHLSKYIDTRSRNRFRLREELQSFRNSLDDELRNLAQQASDLIADADVDARENEALAPFFNLPALQLIVTTVTSWRKPNPGALEFCEIDLYVGDRGEDVEAAQLAGVDFAWAKEYFTRRFS